MQLDGGHSEVHRVDFTDLLSEASSARNLPRPRAAQVAQFAANSLNGPLHPCLCNLRNLVEFSFGGNRLTGDVRAHRTTAIQRTPSL